MRTQPAVRLLSTLAVALALAAAAPAAAQVPGSALLSGTSELKVKGCGKDRGTLTSTLVVADDGTWTSVDLDPEGPALGGSHRLAGKNGRKLALEFDSDSASAFFGSLTADIRELCGRAVTLSSFQQKKFLLELNGKRTKAKLRLVYRLEGSGGGRKSSATMRLKGEGPWTPQR